MADSVAVELGQALAAYGDRMMEVVTLAAYYVLVCGAGLMIGGYIERRGARDEG